MQVFVVLMVCFLSLCSSAPAPQGQVYPDAVPRYQFAYQVNSQDISGPLNYGHAEQRDGVVTRGEYFVLLPDSRLMRVTYYSDATGFHPTYSFQGTAQFPQSNNHFQG